MGWVGSKKNRDKLVQLKIDNNLTKKDLATMLNRSTSTISTYLSKSGVDIPDHLVELLELKLLVKKSQK